MIPLAHDGVTEAGDAWQGEDVAHHWDTPEEVDGHGKESSEKRDKPVELNYHSEYWPAQ